MFVLTFSRFQHLCSILTKKWVHRTLSLAEIHNKCMKYTINARKRQFLFELNAQSKGKRWCPYNCTKSGVKRLLSLSFLLLQFMTSQIKIYMVGICSTVGKWEKWKANIKVETTISKFQVDSFSGWLLGWSGRCGEKYV